MITKIYQPEWLQVLSAALLFALTVSSGQATVNASQTSLTLSDPVPKNVIYLAQSSTDEELKKKPVTKEEEEEEPDCE